MGKCFSPYLKQLEQMEKKKKSWHCRFQNWWNLCRLQSLYPSCTGGPGALLSFRLCSVGMLQGQINTGCWSPRS